MLAGFAKRIYTSGPAGPAGATLAAALTDVIAGMRAVLTAPDLATARAALGLGSAAGYDAAALPLSTAATQALGAKAAAGANADITALGQISGILDTAFAAARGTIAVRGAAAWAPLALGASGYTLQSNGTDLVFAASTPGTGALRYDTALSLTLAQIAQSLANIGIDAAETAVASAATTDIGAAPTQCVAITGTTAITSFGTGAKRVRFIRFAGALTLTYDATKLILPTGANIATAAGDTCVATSDASGNWTVRSYSRADGTPLALGGQSLGNSGYKRLPGGVTLQWGRIGNTNGDTAIAFPVAFSAAPWIVTGTAGSSGATTTLYVFETNMSEVTASGFNARTRLASNGGTVAQAGLDATWFAVGPT